MRVYSDTQIYIVAPAHRATGGPELLHQLCFHLRNDLKMDAYMFYQPADHPDPVHGAYKMYNVPHVTKIEDEERNIIIVPEVTDLMGVIDDYEVIRKVIWWLSINNFYISKLENDSIIRGWRGKLNGLSYRFLRREVFELPAIALEKYSNYNLIDDERVSSADMHLAQSHYAMSHLKEHGLRNVEYLSDYLNESFLKIKTNLKNKENVILYNPRKGYRFTSKLIKKAKELNFKPIINMSRHEVIKELQRAKVYIDFGNHPGKDRIPREAAILGCCVIVGKSGSAAGPDVPIPDEFKFNAGTDLTNIIKKIKDCLENFDKNYCKFDDYRRIIINEQTKFCEDLRRIFESE